MNKPERFHRVGDLLREFRKQTVYDIRSLTQLHRIQDSPFASHQLIKLAGKCTSSLAMHTLMMYRHTNGVHARRIPRYVSLPLAQTVRPGFVYPEARNEEWFVRGMADAGANPYVVSSRHNNLILDSLSAYTPEKFPDLPARVRSNVRLLLLHMRRTSPYFDKHLRQRMVEMYVNAENFYLRELSVRKGGHKRRMIEAHHAADVELYKLKNIRY